MKIYLYLKDFPLDGQVLTSGMSKAVHGLAVGLVGNGADVTVLCEGSTEQACRTDDGYEIQSFADRTAWSRRISISPALKRYVEETVAPSNGLVILNGIFHPSVYALSRILKRNKVPYIIAPHDPYHPSIFSTSKLKKWSYWYLCERPMLRSAAAVQVLDARHGGWLHELGVDRPVIEVVNGFSPEEVLKEEELTWRENGTPKLLFLGRLDAHNKGLDLLVDAFSNVALVTGADLTLQGPDWGDRRELRARAKLLPMGDKITFSPPDYKRAAPAITADFDIFCLPSRFEGFGLSALEAMLAARVLLVSDVAGIAPHVKASGCGVVVTPDAAAVEAGLSELLRLRPKWKEMGLAGRRYALEHLRWDRIAERSMADYRRVLEPPETPRRVTGRVANQVA